MTKVEESHVAGALGRQNVPHKDFALILIGAGILGTTIIAGEYLPLPATFEWVLGLARLALGLAYVLYVPGYCLTAALFPRTDELDSIERAGLSLGLSVAWVPVLALLLNWLPWGLTLGPILAGQLASTAAFAATAIWRRERLPAGEALAPDMGWRPKPWWRSLPGLDRKIYLLCAGALLVAGLAAGWIFLGSSPDEFMTEFYILGSGSLAEDYPREATVGEDLSVTMGIANRERGDMTYRMEVWAVDPWDDRRELVNSGGPFSLSPGELLEQTITWQMPWPGEDLLTEFRLFTEGQEDAEPYRYLQLWLDVSAQP